MLFIGDDWAEGHYDIAVVAADAVLRGHHRLPEDVAEVEKFHAVVADHLLDDAEVAEMVVGIEADRGLPIDTHRSIICSDLPAGRA